MPDQSAGTPDPLPDAETLKAWSTIAGFHIEAGSRAFADFSARMVQDAGEAIRPYLADIYRQDGGTDATEDAAAATSSADEIRARVRARRMAATQGAQASAIETGTEPSTLSAPPGNQPHVEEAPKPVPDVVSSKRLQPNWWIAVLPGSLLAVALSGFALRFILHEAFGHDDGALTVNTRGIERLEYWLTPFFGGLAFVWAGAALAPARKLVTALALGALWMTLLLCVALSWNHGIRLGPAYIEVGPVSRSIVSGLGVLVGLYAVNALDKTSRRA